MKRTSCRPHRFSHAFHGALGVLVFASIALALAAPGSAQAASGTSCPNEVLRAGPAGRLPDCRAYEMVSPPDKAGANIGPGTGMTGLEISYERSAPSGEKFTYSSTGAFAGNGATGNINQYIATRGPDGWTSQGINPPVDGSVFEVFDGTYSVDDPFEGFSEDLSSAWVLNANRTPLTPTGIHGFGNLYRRDNANGAYEALTVAQPPALYSSSWGDNHKGLSLEFRGASSDLSHQVFDAMATLTGDSAVTSNRQVYDLAGGELHLVSILPSGTSSPEAAFVGTSYGNFDATGNSREAQVQGAVSENGSRIFWSTSGSFSNGRFRIYVRKNPDQPQSALALGGGVGAGKVTLGSNTVTELVTAEGTGVFANGSAVVTQAAAGTGRFVVGQPVSSGSVPGGTTVVSVEEESFGKFKLTLSASATSSGKASLKSTGPQPFAVGQAIAGVGIPPGTTIVAVGPGSLTLSAVATESNESGTSRLIASSACTEPEKACTMPVSGVVTSGKADFYAANPSGSKALFTARPPDRQQAAGEGDLYELDVDTGTPTLIAQESRGVVGASTDLSHVYFVSKASLAPGATAGENNLYLDHDGAISFIAALSADDLSPPGLEQTTLVQTSPLDRNSRVTANGQHVAFVSDSSALAQETASYDNSDVVTGDPDWEVYLFSVGSGLKCVSCNPAGDRPAGEPLRPPHGGTFAEVVYTAARIPTWGHEEYAERVLSEDGGRLFFNSIDPLVLRDTNGQQDVYEWEAPGTGTCSEGASSYSPRNGGCVSLISTGESPKPSEFVDASADGHDVFFRTESSIDPRDPGLVDLYDARVDGGFPLPLEPPPCVGDGCQNVPAAPNDPTPASSAYEGPGDVTEKQARKKHERKKKHGRKHRKQSGKHKRHGQQRLHGQAANHNRRTAR